MNKNHIMLIIQIFCLMSFIAGIVIAEPAAGKDGCQDPLLVNQSQEKKVITDGSGDITLIDEDTQAEADTLAGTCPKGFHCSCPGCPLFGDLDEDSFCDRGEELEDSL